MTALKKPPSLRAAAAPRSARLKPAWLDNKQLREPTRERTPKEPKARRGCSRGADALERLRRAHDGDLPLEHVGVVHQAGAEPFYGIPGELCAPRRPRQPPRVCAPLAGVAASQERDGATLRGVATVHSKSAPLSCLRSNKTPCCSLPIAADCSCRRRAHRHERSRTRRRRGASRVTLHSAGSPTPRSLLCALLAKRCDAAAELEGRSKMRVCRT